jgi:hypothetical protein
LKDKLLVTICLIIICVLGWNWLRSVDDSDADKFSGKALLTNDGVSDAKIKATIDPAYSARAAQRERYVEELNKSIEPRATARAAQDVLEIKSFYFADKSVRDETVGRTFGSKTLAVLCKIGFRQIHLYATYFGDDTGFLEGDTPVYSVCKASQEDQARAEYAKRQDMARQLSASQASGSGIRVDAVGTELVITTPDADSHSAKAYIGTWDGSTRRGACALGFTGLRVRKSLSSKGDFISYHCSK